MDGSLHEEGHPVQESERGDPADWDWPSESPAEPTVPEPDVHARSERQRPKRWSTEEKARIVRESFWPGERVNDVAQRYGLSSRQLSSWRTLAREGKLTLPSSAGPELEPVAMASEPGSEPAFATLEVDPAPEPDRGTIGSVSIEARGVTVRLDGDIGARRIAEVASLLRALR